MQQRGNLCFIGCGLTISSGLRIPNCTLFTVLKGALESPVNAILAVILFKNHYKPMNFRDTTRCRKYKWLPLSTEQLFAKGELRSNCALNRRPAKQTASKRVDWPMLSREQLRYIAKLGFKIYDVRLVQSKLFFILIQFCNLK